MQDGRGVVGGLGGGSQTEAACEEGGLVVGVIVDVDLVILLQAWQYTLASDKGNRLCCLPRLMPGRNRAACAADSRQDNVLVCVWPLTGVLQASQ